MLALPYLNLKSSISRRLAESAAEPKVAVRSFAGPKESSEYVTARLRWTGDKWWLDAYHDPRHLQACMELGLQPLHVDCDDFAVWCYASLAQLPGYRVRLWTALDFWLAASHVVCSYEAPDGTCGLFSNGVLRPLAEVSAQSVLADVASEFSSYRWAPWWPAGKFVQAVETPYPFPL